MKTKQKIPAILLMSISLAAPALAETIQCRAESANIIAGLKSESSEQIESEALVLARRAALIMCERKLNVDLRTANRDEENSETGIAETVDTIESPKEKRRGFLGLSLEKTERNEGHRRLQKRN